MTRAPYVGLHVSSGERRATAADIVASVQREIASGALPAGSRLPPVRALEKQLGLSKNTAQAAYDEARRARARRGNLPAEARGACSCSPRSASESRSRGHDAGAAAAPRAAAAVAPGLHAARHHEPVDGVHRSRAAADRAHRRVRALGRARAHPAQYDAQGYRPLREAIAKRLQARGLDVEADEVVVTTGSQQSLDIVARALATPRIALESPVYAYAKLLFESLGHRLVGCTSIRSRASTWGAGTARSRRSRRSRT
ncbi:MAG: GntR family transcriptional regulator [Deltaproteobacteria bacterium]|nr:GntR family transcriptional regulator [Deltaproteobacteria bacterium]